MPFDGTQFRKPTLPDLAEAVFAAPPPPHLAALSVEVREKLFDQASYRERLAMLALALRQPLPRDFAFNFCIVHAPAALARLLGHHHPCGTVGCAIGLAIELWPAHMQAADGRTVSFASVLEIGRQAFGLTAAINEKLFLEGSSRRENPVTAAEVAKRIDAFLALPP